MAKEKKAKSQKKKPLKIILIVLAAIAGIGLIVLGVFAGSVFKYKKTAKNMVKDVVTETFRQNESSVIYDINGEEITAFSGIKEIYYVDGADIPDIMKQIFIITEDKDFYKHKGVDLSSIFRAAIANMKHKEITQGASTITQQLARNMFLTHEVSWERKITEMFVAMELEKKFSKAQILEFYLNNIYFANGYYGVEAAAQGYFSKKVSDLSTSQLAFLASIPNNPAKYDPVVNFDKTMERRNLLLKQLFTNGYIDSLEYYSAIEEKIQLIDSGDDKIDYVETYIFYCATRALMEKDGFVFRNEFTSEEDEENYRNVYEQWYSEYQAKLFTDGYKIYTAIDMEKEELLQATVDKYMADFVELNDEGIYKTQAAAVCIDNSTGLVTAIVGGRSQEHDGYTFNRAFQAYRQPGSCIKPLNVYAPYMMLGHTPEEEIEDYYFVGGPKNYSNIYRGKITLKEALAWSSNVCAWKLMQEMTCPYGMSFLDKLEFDKSNVDNETQAASIGGFTYGVSPVEICKGYAALENDGVARNATCIDKITNATGSIIVDNTGKDVEVYDKQAARKVTKMMEYGVEEGLIQSAKLKNAIVAAKTGSTNDNKDGWMSGFSRYYTTTVWAGNDIPVSIEGLGGGTYPLRIWREFMEKIHEGLELKPFPDYEGIETDKDNVAGYDDDGENGKEQHAPGGADMDIDDGDRYTHVNGDGDVDVDVSGMGDRDAR